MEHLEFAIPASQKPLVRIHPGGGPELHRPSDDVLATRKFNEPFRWDLGGGQAAVSSVQGASLFAPDRRRPNRVLAGLNRPNPLFNDIFLGCVPTDPNVTCSGYPRVPSIETEHGQRAGAVGIEQRRLAASEVRDPGLIARALAPWTRVVVDGPHVAMISV